MIDDRYLSIDQLDKKECKELDKLISDYLNGLLSDEVFKKALNELVAVII